MRQIPAGIWNEIAQSQTLKAQPWAMIAKQEPEDLEAELQKLEQKLDKEGVPNKVILAYLLTAPLLMENQAISRFIQETQQYGLRSSLPELTTISEAVALATAEYRLTALHQKRLKSLLKR